MSSRLEKERLAGMRGGGNRASQALYRPGSGPLRKTRSGSTADDYDNEIGMQDKSRSTSVQHRLRQSQSNRSNQAKDSPPLSQIDDVTEKLDNTHIHYRSNSSIDQSTSHNISNTGAGDPKKKHRKPEQPLYVPKKVKEALAEQDATNR